MEAMRGSQKSIILVARQLGVHIGPNDIPERLQIEDRELKPKEMCELAQSFGLKAKATKINEKELLKLLTKKQQILRLKNGRYIIGLRVITGEKEDDKSILCLDTGVTSPKPQQISLKELKKGWEGEIILLKAKLKKFEEDSE
jgi:ABC-type bacteriocin/lantibiotic exporter with double-glycine peptidase domain